MNKNAIDVKRYVNVATWDFTLEVITPAFLGGSNSNAELRSASFKGLLRYWWRVLYGAKYGDNILKKESEVFGTATGEKSGGVGKSNVQIIISPLRERKEFVNLIDDEKKYISLTGKYINRLEYLTFGLDSNKRKALLNGTLLNLKLIVNKNYSTEVLQAFLFLCKYGGIGSKNRNGFGSLKIVKSSPVATISKDMLYVAPQVQSYSCLSKSSKLFYTKNAFNTWEDVMLELADIYIDARSSLEKLHTFERRGLLARPIISKKDKHNIPKEVYGGRHPKFLKMVVSKLKNGQYCGIILTLPIQFYESKNIRDYDGMVKDIHDFLSKKMIDKTNDLIGELQ